MLSSITLQIEYIVKKIWTVYWLIHFVCRTVSRETQPINTSLISMKYFKNSVHETYV